MYLGMMTSADLALLTREVIVACKQVTVFASCILTV
jgi:hypothetical protein